MPCKRNPQHVQPDFDKKGRTYRYIYGVQEKLFEPHKELKKQNTNINENILMPNQKTNNLVDENEKLESRLRVAETVSQQLQKSYSDCSKLIIYRYENIKI